MYVERKFIQLFIRTHNYNSMNKDLYIKKEKTTNSKSHRNIAFRVEYFYVVTNSIESYT